MIQKNVSYDLVLDELGNLYNLNTISNMNILEDALQFQISDSLTKAMSVVANVKGVTVADGIKMILNAFSVTTLLENISCSDGFPLAYRLLALNNPFGGLANTPIAQYMTADANMYELNGGNSVWSFLQGFIPNPWCEFFTESGGRTMVTDGFGVPSVLFPGFNYATVRTAPYSNPLLGVVNPKWLTNTLLYDTNAIQMLIGGDFIIITDDMISDKSIGFDCSNQSTVFRTIFSNKASGGGSADLNARGIKSVGPLNPFASGGISTFGIREMNQTIDCTSQHGFGVGTSYIERFVKNFGLPSVALGKGELSNLLSVWFRNQSRFREGSVTTQMIPYARAGMYCLYLPSISGKKVDNVRDIGIYYIDSLNHSYNIENEDLSATTTLNLIRGVPLPNSIAKTAMLLFDYEIIPPVSGLADGEYSVLKALRTASSI